MDEGFRFGLLVSAYALGFRHGIDWDHLAAITDISSTQDRPRRAIVLASLYVLGHAAVVFVLGMIAVIGGDLIPDGVDEVMGRVVGLTLVTLGVYVLWALVRHGRDFRMRSRWMLAIAGARRAWSWARNGHGRQGRADREPVYAGAPAPVPQPATEAALHDHDPFAEYGNRTAVGVGVLHGVGAETPTQILIFLAAAGAGGTMAGMVTLLAFLGGLVTANSVISVAAAYGFLGANRRFTVYAVVAVITGVVSIAIGLLFLLGRDSALPAILVG